MEAGPRSGFAVCSRRSFGVAFSSAKTLSNCFDSRSRSSGKLGHSFVSDTGRAVLSERVGPSRSEALNCSSAIQRRASRRPTAHVRRATEYDWKSHPVHRSTIQARPTPEWTECRDEPVLPTLGSSSSRAAWQLSLVKACSSVASSQPCDSESRQESSYRRWFATV